MRNNEAVLDYAHEVAAREPGVLYALTTPDDNLEVYRGEDGQVVVWAYRSVASLVADCGGGQPWQRVTAAELAEVARRTGLSIMISLDVPYAAGARYPEPDRRLPPKLDRIEPAAAGRDGPAEPELVWIPVRPAAGEGARRLEAELVLVEPRKPMLALYTSADSLRACCGPHQAAVAIDPARLDEVVREIGAERVLVDLELPEEHRHQAPVARWNRVIPFGNG